LYATDVVTFIIPNVNITDGEWHDIQWTRMRNLTSLDYKLSVLVDGTIGSSADVLRDTDMSEDASQLAINGTAYFHIAGLADFDNIPGKPITIAHC